MFGTGDDLRQFGKHLAAVAHAQTESIWSSKESLELIRQHGVKRDRPRPADARAQRVAVAEAAACHDADEVFQVRPAGLQVGHVDVKGVKTGFGEALRHLDMRVDALLAQDGDFGASQI